MTIRRFRLLAVLLLFAIGAVRAERQEPTPAQPSTVPAPIDGGFTLVVVPDTQNYLWLRPELYTLQTGWIAANIDRYHIVHLLHVGDITQHNNREEWEGARRAHEVYRGLVPAAYVSGNHDLGPDGTTETRGTLFTEYITLADYRRQPGFGGVYDKEPDRTENSYHLFNAGGREWLILALEYAPREDVVRWANEIVARYPRRGAILLTHTYLNRDGLRYERGKKQPGPPEAFPIAQDPAGANDGEALWQKLVSRHSNFALVVSGHIGISAHLASTGVHGNTVHQIVVDYQEIENGGNGWLRLMQFHPDGKTLTIRDYSPLLNQTIGRETLMVAPIP